MKLYLVRLYKGIPPIPQQREGEGEEGEDNAIMSNERHEGV